MPKLIINYLPNTGSSISDSYVLDYAKSIVDSFNQSAQTRVKDVIVSVSTECAITAFRVMAKRGLIKPEEILFVNECEEHCPVNRNSQWLTHLCPANSVYESMLMELI